ncbi:hypothetical protein PIROE2DRAFT_16793, partial [Piromyces sp. E2]
NSLCYFLVIAINIALIWAGDVYKCTKDNTRIYGNNKGQNYVGAWLDTGDYIYATGTSNGYAKFYKGYVSLTGLQKQTTTKNNYKVTADDGLNFRSGPGTGYNKLTLKNYGTGVVYYGRDWWERNWGVTNFGYCSMDYLTSCTNCGSSGSGSTGGGSTDSGSAGTSNGSTILSINKNIRQNDFPYVYDHNSDGSPCTIADVGCLITSISLALSQIDGKNYTPVTVISQHNLRFSYCDAINYGHNGKYTNDRNQNLNVQLKNLYNSIVNKHRVAIFGSSNYNWPHFVAVYGYNGKNANNLKASDFLVHDPSRYYDTLIWAGDVYKCTKDNTRIYGNNKGQNYVGAWLDTGDYIYATGTSNGYAKFYKGYVSLTGLQKQTTTKNNYKVTADDGLNFRSGPGTGYNKLTLKNYGTGVVYYGRDWWERNWGVTNFGY